MKNLFFVMVLASLAVCFQPVTIGFLTSSAFAATKAQKKKARAVCRKKYGKRYIKTVLNKSGNRYTCYYRKTATASRTRAKTMTREQMTEWCKKTYKGIGEGLRAVKKGSKWYCQYRW